jgi:hypothetical protein
MFQYPKPKPMIQKVRNGRTVGYPIAEVFEDYFSEQFAEEGDPIRARLGMLLFGENVFEGYTTKARVLLARRLSAWLLRYALWLEDKIRFQEHNKMLIEED